MILHLNQRNVITNYFWHLIIQELQEITIYIYIVQTQRLCDFFQIQTHKLQQPGTLGFFHTGVIYPLILRHLIDLHLRMAARWGREKIGDPWKRLHIFCETCWFEPPGWICCGKLLKIHEASPWPFNFIEMKTQHIESLMQQHGQKCMASCAWHCGQMHHANLRTK